MEIDAIDATLTTKILLFIALYKIYMKIEIHITKSSNTTYCLHTKDMEFQYKQNILIKVLPLKSNIFQTRICVDKQTYGKTDKKHVSNAIL